MLGHVSYQCRKPMRVVPQVKCGYCHCYPTIGWPRTHYFDGTLTPRSGVGLEPIEFPRSGNSIGSRRYVSCSKLNMFQNMLEHVIIIYRFAELVSRQSSGFMDTQWCENSGSTRIKLEALPTLACGIGTKRFGVNLTETHYVDGTSMRWTRTALCCRDPHVLTY
jgi:hypothetical protein